jgi:hypothetical protein
MAHKKEFFKAEEVKKYILATGDTSSSLVAKTRTSRQLNLFKALTILGSETGFSGTAKAKVENKFLSDTSASDPAIDRGADPNLQNVNQVASFGKQLLNSLGANANSRKRQKPSAGAVAEDPNSSKEGN